MDQTTTQKTYICTGSCGAHISQDEFDGGLTTCGTEGCTMHGHPFTEESAGAHSSHVVVKTENDTDEDVVINN
jgi:hypothetical protein